MEKLDLKFKIFFSRLIKRPTKSHFEQFIELFDSRKEIVIHCEEKNKKFFTSSNIYFSIESSFDCIVKMVINFGKCSLYVYEGTLSTKQIQDLRESALSNSSYEKPILNYFMTTEKEVRKTFKLSSIKYQENEIPIQTIPVRVDDLSKSYINFLKQRNTLIKLREDRTKSAREFSQNKIEKDVLIRTLKLHKWHLKNIEVYLIRKKK